MSLRAASPVRRVVVIVLLAIVALAVASRIYLGPLPSTDLQSGRLTSPSTLILDREGRVLYETLDASGGRQQPISLAEMPLALRQAVVATEDARFYLHPGVDPLAIIRAALANAQAGEIVSGASTIPQQLARMVLLPEEERTELTLRRKLREAILAVRLSLRYSRDELLELYLNQTYFGAYAYGVDAAAWAYFDKPVQQLDLAESAMLAGIIQAPGVYNPLTHPDAALRRQETVLGLMVDSGYLTKEQAEEAATEKLHFASDADEMLAPHAVIYARDELESLLTPEQIAAGGLRVTTTIDLPLQQYAERSLARHLEELNTPQIDEPAHDVDNGAVIALDVDSGGIRVMVGSPDYANTEISGAVNSTLALRQPGSSIKPFTYAAAFEQGYSPGTMLSDVPTTFATADGKTYKPINFDYRYHGPVLLRQALACSYNVVAVELLDQVGVQALPDLAQRAGVRSLANTAEHGLAMTLGSAEVTLLEMARGYSTLARNGRYLDTYIIEEVQAADGTVLYRHMPTRAVQVIEPRAAYLVTDVLADDDARMPAFGSNSPLETGLPAAVKTGTTTDWRDNWTLGYTVSTVVGVWVGNADGSPMEGVTGISGAAPVWHDVLLAAHGTPPSPFEQPDGLVTVRICSLSGKLAGIACPHARDELFRAEDAPTETCDMHVLANIDVRTGEPVPGACAAGQCVTKSVVVWPDDLLAWAIGEGLTTPTRATELARQAVPQAETEASEPSVVIARPADGARYVLDPAIPAENQLVGVQVDVRGMPSDSRAVTLLIDGVEVVTWESPPYSWLWQLDAGQHQFLAIAEADGDASIASGTVIVDVQDKVGG